MHRWPACIRKKECVQHIISSARIVHIWLKRQIAFARHIQFRYKRRETLRLAPARRQEKVKHALLTQRIVECRAYSISDWMNAHRNMNNYLLFSIGPNSGTKHFTLFCAFFVLNNCKLLGFCSFEWINVWVLAYTVIPNQKLYAFQRVTACVRCKSIVCEIRTANIVKSVAQCKGSASA